MAGVGALTVAMVYTRAPVAADAPAGARPGFGGNRAVASAPSVTPTAPPGPGPAPGAPQVEWIARALGPYLPTGYAVAGLPVLAGEASPDGRYTYRVPLQAKRTLYRVPTAPVRLGTGVPAFLRENRASLVLHRALPPGREYDLEAAREDARMDGTWRVRLDRRDGAWRVVEAGPVWAQAASGADAGVLLTEAEMSGIRAERREALAGYTARLRVVEGEVKALRASALRDVPPQCRRDVATLLGEVVRLASDCPSVADPAQRSICFQRRDRANQELGACERQNQLHDERAGAARSAVAVHRSERLAGLARELAREARLHGQTLGN